MDTRRDINYNIGALTKKESMGKRFTKALKRDKYLWLLILPGLIYYAIFHYGPMYGLVIAFENFSPYRGILGGPWVGFQWFEEFFNSYYFWRLIVNTLLLNVYGIIFSFPIPIILALLLNEVQHSWYKKIVQTVSYLPHFISTVIIVGLVVNFLSPSTGIVNHFLQLIGIEPIHFMIKPEWFRTIYIASGVWQGAGWGSIIYLAAMSGINPELYEAATIDGATKLQQIRHVTIPGILPTVIIMLILNMGSMLSVGYEKIILMYNPATYETADVINTYVYRRGIIGGEFSFGTAVGLFQSIVNLIFVATANNISKRLTETSLW